MCLDICLAHKMSRGEKMPRYNEKDYSISNALKNIGDYFWRLYKDDLKAYAEDRTRNDIITRIHEEWDNPPLLKPFGTDIRIEWALAIYDHGDWEKCQSYKVPSYKTQNTNLSMIDPRRRYPAEYRSENGINVRSISELCIANWLYFNRIPFEYERQVVFKKSNVSAYCDFYLPEKDIYIELWGMSKDPAYMEYKQWKEPLYLQNGYKLVSLYPNDLKNLRDRLALAISKIK